MQFFWKYIDDLMGKGLSVSVLIELLFYVSASLIPLALPLAILLSSIMTFGNLSENNELTALKASGLSLYRIMRPLTGAVIIIAISTFYFANFVIPVANLKWRSLIYDIQNTKIASILTPGVYTKELDGYAIKVEEKTESTFKKIIIHDHTLNNEVKTIRADHGRMYKSDNGQYLFFELNQGSVMEEMASQAPMFDTEGTLVRTPNNNRPTRRTKFNQLTYKIDISGFSLNRTDQDLFKNEYEMLNVFQLAEAKDSLQRRLDEVRDRFAKNTKMSLPFVKAENFAKIDTTKVEDEIEDIALPAEVFIFDSLPAHKQKETVIASLSRVNRELEGLKSQKSFIESLDNNVRFYAIETHRKFSLTYAILVLFFVGAPLGAIVRKGGFGAPVVIAALLFMVYFVLTSIGEELAKSGVVSPFLGMWFAPIILTPLAIWLTRSAANDSQLFNMDAWLKYFERFKKKNETTPN
ncbi:MAG: lipopolysaccharide export system permease protein [Lentimonas sp.]|jgi:lipopolysaccharide export system permease protein